MVDSVINNGAKRTSAISSKKPVLFISSALSPDSHPDKSKVFDYFVVIAAKLSIEMRKLDYEVVLMVPHKQSSAAEDQKSFLEQLHKITLHESYSGLIIAPFDTTVISDQLGYLVSKNKCLQPVPILTIDKSFDAFKSNITEEVPPYYVVSNWEKGGELAAESIISYFMHNKSLFDKNTVINIAIIEGLQGSKERIMGFNAEIERENLKNQHLQFKTKTTLQGRFNRVETEKLIDNNYKKLFEDDGIRAFFCCNDEMALGVRDVLFKQDEWLMRELNQIKNKRDKRREDFIIQQNKLYNIKIVGFDGISEVRVHIDNKDKWIINSINVNVFEQVKHLAELFDSLLNNKPVESITATVDWLRSPHTQNNSFYG